MASRRSLTTKAFLIRRWYHPMMGHIAHHRSEIDESFHSPSSSQLGCGITNFVLAQIQNRITNHVNGGLGALFGHSKYFPVLSFTPAVRPSYCRYMSSAIEEGSDNVDRLGDVTEILTDKTVEVVSSQASAINEVAIAAADSAFPVAAVQYLIDAVHSFTGLNWWAAIAVTTILIRGATLPFLINQLKATYKLNLIRPRMEEIKQKVQESGTDPITVAEGHKEMNALLKEYGVGAFTPLKGLLIQGPIFISFVLAISNMVEKVPSFKAGGAFWFTDLTTPDSLYIFPVLASLSFLITVECNMEDSGNPSLGSMKNTSRVIAVLAVPFTMAFPKALLCYWITSNLFTVSYGLAIKQLEVRKLLDLPESPIPPAPQPQPQSCSTSAFQQHNTAEDESKQSPESSKVANRRISKDAILRQRIRNLEKQLKGRKSNKNQ